MKDPHASASRPLSPLWPLLVIAATALHTPSALSAAGLEPSVTASSRPTPRDRHRLEKLRALGDRDNDGYRTDRMYGGTDCDDSDPSIHPGATETCDGVDQDCDGAVDDNAGATYYPDEDEDGFGSSSTSVKACSPPAGYLNDSGDCDDQDPAVHPGELEVIDGRDQDCDGTIDETDALAHITLEDMTTTGPELLGDINGDGYDDFVVNGATSAIFLGGPWIGDVQSFDSSRADVRFDGAACSGQLGSYRALGDINADGFDDFGLLCTSSSDYTRSYLNIYLGRDRFSTFNLSRIDGSIVSPGSSQILTTVAHYSGDLNRDGIPDLLLGLSNDSSRYSGGGRVAVFLGGTLWPLGTSVNEADIWIYGYASQHLGVAVETVGDLDGDGYPEVVVTDNPNNAKERFQAFTALGAQLGEQSVYNAAAMIYSDTQTTGLKTTYVGDLSGDGTDDLVMGDGYVVYIALTDGGAWYLSDLVVLMSSIATDQLRLATPASGYYNYLDLTPAGDMNGDGYADLLAGSWGGSSTTSSATGSVYLILGVSSEDAVSGWPSPSGLFSTCTSSYCLCGSPGSFDGNGDLDGDGRDDLVIGGLDTMTAVTLGY